ncbi:hypothetical protein MMC15_006634 [Xylographa vitiligo]|nr:hypothetical protein [Xylographa vitiligo]
MTTKHAKALYQKKLHAENKKNYRSGKVAQWKERRDTERKFTDKADREKPHPRMERREDNEVDDCFVVNDADEPEARRYVYVSSDDEGSTFTTNYGTQKADRVDSRLLESAGLDGPQIQKWSWIGRQSEASIDDSQTFVHIDDLVEVIDISDAPHFYKAPSTGTLGPEGEPLKSIQPSLNRRTRRKLDGKKNITSQQTQRPDHVVTVNKYGESESRLVTAQETSIKGTMKLTRQPRELDLVQVIEMYESERSSQDIVEAHHRIPRKPKTGHGKKRRISEVECDSDQGEYFETMVAKKKHKVARGQPVDSRLAPATAPSKSWLSQMPDKGQIERETFNHYYSNDSAYTLNNQLVGGIANARDENVFQDGNTFLRQDETLILGTTPPDTHQAKLLLKMQSVVQVPASPLMQARAPPGAQLSKQSSTIQDVSTDEAPLVVRLTPIRDQAPTAVVVDPYQVLVPCTPRPHRVRLNSPKIQVPRTPPVRLTSRSSSEILVPRTPSNKRKGTNKDSVYFPTGSQFFERVKSVPSTQQGGVTINGQLVLTSQMYVPSKPTLEITLTIVR